MSYIFIDCAGPGFSNLDAKVRLTLPKNCRQPFPFVVPREDNKAVASNAGKRQMGHKLLLFTQSFGADLQACVASRYASFNCLQVFSCLSVP